MVLPVSPFRARSSIQKGATCLLIAVASALLIQPVHAQTVTAAYTLTSGIFSYNVTVNNTTSFTLADVNIYFPTGATATNLAAPTGFQTTFDSGGNGPNMGIIDFTSTDGTKDFFANTKISGFLFRSNTQLNGATFNTLDVNGTSNSGTLVTSAAGAPEPGALGLLGFGLTPAAAALLTFRRRTAASASSKG